MKALYKVAGSYIELEKIGNVIIETDQHGFTQKYIFNGSIQNFMKDTYKSYEVAGIAVLPSRAH